MALINFSGNVGSKLETIQFSSEQNNKQVDSPLRLASSIIKNNPDTNDLYLKEVTFVKNHLNELKMAVIEKKNILKELDMIILKKENSITCSNNNLSKTICIFYKKANMLINNFYQNIKGILYKK